MYGIRVDFNWHSHYGSLTEDEALEHVADVLTEHDRVSPCLLLLLQTTINQFKAAEYNTGKSFSFVGTKLCGLTTMDMFVDT